MANLISTLTIKLVDQLTSSAKTVTQSLQGIEKTVDAAAKGKGADQLATSLSSLEKAAVSAGKSLNANWSRGFTEQIGKLNLSARELDRVKASYDGLMRSLSGSGGMRASVALPRIGEWERSTIASLRHVSQEQSAFARRSESIGTRLSKVGLGMAGLYSAERVGKEAIEKGAEGGREEARRWSAGFTPEEQARARARSTDLSARFPSVGQVQISEHMRNLKGTLGTYEHADEMIEDVVRSRVMLQGQRGTEAAKHDLDEMTKGLEGAGYGADPERFRNVLHAFVKGVNVFGDSLKGEDFRTYIKTAKTSKYGLSEDFLSTVVPTMLQHEGANQFGTGQATAFNALLGGHMTKKAKAALKGEGLLDKDEKVLDAALLESHPLNWAVKNLKPRLEKEGADLSTEEGRGKVTETMSKWFSSRGASEYFTSLLANESVIRKDMENLKLSKGPEAAEELRTRDPFVAFSGLTTQFGDAIQNLVKGPLAILTPALNYFASAIGEVNKKFQSLSPEAQAGIGAGALAAGTGAAIWGAVRAAKAGRRFLFGSPEKKAAAAALEGAGGIASTIATDAEKVAAKPGLWRNAARFGGKAFKALPGVSTAVTAFEAAQELGPEILPEPGIAGKETLGERAKKWRGGTSIREQIKQDADEREKAREAAEPERHSGVHVIDQPTPSWLNNVNPTAAAAKAVEYGMWGGEMLAKARGVNVPGLGPAAAATNALSGLDEIYKESHSHPPESLSDTLLRNQGSTPRERMQAQFSEDRERLNIPADPGAAAAAGQVFGAAFREALGRELGLANAMVDAAVQQLIQRLNFSANPAIAPTMAPAAGAAGQKMGSLDGNSLHEVYADAGFGGGVVLRTQSD